MKKEIKVHHCLGTDNVLDFCNSNDITIVSITAMNDISFWVFYYENK